MKLLGFQADDVEISGFDSRDALVGHSVAYEIDVEIGRKVVPVKLLEDVNRWEHVDLPFLRVEELARAGVDNELVEQKRISDDGLPFLAPFQLAGPMELWVQDAKAIRISLPVSFYLFFPFYNKNSLLPSCAVSFYHGNSNYQFY